ncbi:MAG TPA: acyl-CoA reductase, partial [Chitinophagaceae bacterium]|nr:acyl-CoA reductase [Chitinophagaceae bacterium]
SFLQEDSLSAFAARYNLPGEIETPKTVGLVMAGNIPLVGFHDFLCVFLSGHNVVIKPSSKDNILIKHLAAKLYQWEITVQNQVSFSELLKGCDAHIATGSNNSARYFDYYFKKYPHIIRRNRTSVAILTGEETPEQLEWLSDDVHLYFGMGCRNVTKLYVPEGYDFAPLLESFRKYSYFADHNKYKNNYDYQLAIHLLNKQYYMTNGSILLSENTSLFSPISQLNYSFYENAPSLGKELTANNDVQCIVGAGHVVFGQTQSPSLTDYADGVDTMEFLSEL